MPASGSRFTLPATVVLCALPALAGAQHVGSEFQVNTYTTADQLMGPGSRDASGGQVAADASGNFVVVWSSSGQDGEISGIFAQRYDSGGTPQGSEFRVNSYTSNGQSMPSVAMAPEGNFVVAWTSCCQDGDFQGIFGRRYDSEGTAQGSEFRVNSYTTRNQTSPSVASDASGNFVVVWTSDRQYEDGWGVFGQRYDGGGTTQGAEFRVPSYTTGAQHEPFVAMSPTGGFVVVWASEDQDGSAYGIFGQRYDRAGTPQGSEFRVNSYTTSFQSDPSVSSDASGNFVVVWQGPALDETLGVLGQRYDGQGQALGAEFRVNTYTTGRQSGASVASDASGNFVVGWRSINQDGSGDGVFGKRYDGAGVPHGDEFRVNSYTTGDQQFPSMVATGVGQFVLAWESEGQDGSGLGVFGQRVDFGGDTIPPSVAVTAPNGGERLFTGSSYRILWTASDHTALSSFDVFVSVDGGGSFAPIPECQNVPGTETSCVWLAPAPPSATDLVRVTAEDTSGNEASDESDAVFAIIAGSGVVTVDSPNTDVKWQVGSLQTIEWMHNLGVTADFRIELDRDDDGSYEELIAAAAPADGARSGRFEWTVTGPLAAACRVRVSWTANPAVSDASDVTFQITLDPAEFQVNTYTTGDQGTGYFAGRLVAADANGNFVVVWNSDDQDGSGGGLFGQRYDSDGHTRGSEFRVNAYTTGFQGAPSVTSDGSGNFVVVWESADGGDTGIFARRFDSAGLPQGAEFRVNSTTSGEQASASVAAHPGGEFVVAWESEHLDGFDDIFAQRYDGQGNSLGGEFRVNSYTAGFQYRPAVARDPSGEFVVVWGSSPGGYGAPSSIYGRRFDGAGQRLGGEFLVSSTGSPPSIDSDASGNFVVVWHRWGAYGGEEVYGRRFDSEGVPLGPQFRVNTEESGYQQHPAVASDASGSFVVVWESAEQDGQYFGVFGQRYDSAGGPQGGEFQVNAHTTGQQGRPSLAATGPGRFTAVWTSDDQDGFGEGVFGTHLAFGAGAITVESPNTNVKWRIGSLHRIQWTHSLGVDATFRIELDRDDDGSYEELIAAEAPAEAARGHFGWTVTGPPSGTARVRVSWTEDPSVSDAGDVTFQIRPIALD